MCGWLEIGVVRCVRWERKTVMILWGRRMVVSVAFRVERQARTAKRTHGHGTWRELITEASKTAGFRLAWVAVSRWALFAFVCLAFISVSPSRPLLTHMHGQFFCTCFYFLCFLFFFV